MFKTFISWSLSNGLKNSEQKAFLPQEQKWPDNPWFVHPLYTSAPWNKETKNEPFLAVVNLHP